MSAEALKTLSIDDISAFERALPPTATDPLLVLAVSGGADSMAMMHLCADLIRARGRGRILVLTVDHALREHSAAEAQFVRREAEALGLQHATLMWSGEKPSTGLQARARAERYRLLKEAYDGAQGDPKWLLTAHTLDDQAETFLMRLARGSGIDGLCGISEAEVFTGSQAGAASASDCDGTCTSVMHVLRPLLSVTKARLKAFLLQRGKTWIEDPSNENDAFERIRVRKALGVLKSVGLSPAAIATSARRLSSARDALDVAVLRILEDERLVRLDDMGFAQIARETWVGTDSALSPFVRLRLLSQIVAAVGGASEPQSLKSMEAIARDLEAAMQEGRSFGATIGRAQLRTAGSGLLIVREEHREPPPPQPMIPGTRLIWDGRFVLTLHRESPELVLRQLGSEGLKALRDQGVAVPACVPLEAVRVVPSLWQNGNLVSVFGLIAGAGRTGSAVWLRNPARLLRSKYPSH